MKNTLFRIVTVSAILYANSAFAANGVEGGGMSLIGWIFIGFMALIVAFQFTPAMMMFGSMMAGFFGKAKNHEGITDNGKSNNS